MNRKSRKVQQREKSFRAALEGETFWYKHTPGTTYTVAPKSEGNAGRWVCCSCGEPFDNQIQKDIHIGARAAKRDHMIETKGPKVAHVFAWISFTSGNPEVP